MSHLPCDPLWGERAVPPHINHRPADDALSGQNHVWCTYSIFQHGVSTHFVKKKKKSVSII